MEKFNTNVEMELDLDSVCPENFRYESRNLNIDIEYHFMYEIREWGIKSFSFILPNQELVLNLEIFNEEKNHQVLLKYLRKI